MTNGKAILTRDRLAGLTWQQYSALMKGIVDQAMGRIHRTKTLSVSSTIQNTKMRYRVTAVEITDTPGIEALQTVISKEIEVYSQTLTDLNLSTLIRALNPTTRKRRAKKEGSA
jgi:hypothetical protein